MDGSWIVWFPDQMEKELASAPDVFEKIRTHQASAIAIAMLILIYLLICWLLLKFNAGGSRSTAPNLGGAHFTPPAHQGPALDSLPGLFPFPFLFFSFLLTNQVHRGSSCFLHACAGSWGLPVGINGGLCMPCRCFPSLSSQQLIPPLQGKACFSSLLKFNFVIHAAHTTSNFQLQTIPLS